MKRVLREYHNRIIALEDQKFDFEYIVKKKDYEVLARKKSKKIKKQKNESMLQWERYADVTMSRRRNDAQCCCTWVMYERLLGYASHAMTNSLGHVWQRARKIPSAVLALRNRNIAIIYK